MGGPATYPGVNDMGDTCADMQSIHNGLGIPGDVFDKFVMDLGGVLIADGVADADIATIAGAVTGTKTRSSPPHPSPSRRVTPARDSSHAASAISVRRWPGRAAPPRPLWP